MSYRCLICKTAVPSGQTCLKHVVMRQVVRFGRAETEIARELPVCPSCKGKLDCGIALDVLLEDHRPIAVPVALKLFQEAVEGPAKPLPPRKVSF